MTHPCPTPRYDTAEAADLAREMLQQEKPYITYVSQACRRCKGITS